MSVVKVIDPCPLDCGRSFHGLPLEATTLPLRSYCPSPWGAPQIPGQAPGNAVDLTAPSKES